MKNHHNPRLWSIRQRPGFFTGQKQWVTIPPRQIYAPTGQTIVAHKTYDQALGHVRHHLERKPIVFESKTRPGQWFWVRTDGGAGWARAREWAEYEANRKDGH